MQSGHIRKHNKYLIIVPVSIIALVIVVINSLVTLAATTPSLGAAASYGVLSNTYANGAGATINGDVGFIVAPASTPLGLHPNYGSGPPYATAGQDQDVAFGNLAAQPCTFTWGAAVDLSADSLHGTPGVYEPGVYCSTGAMSVTGPLTLTGNGSHIFRAVGALSTAAASSMTLLDGASTCDVFWTPTGATSLGASSTFTGTVIEDIADITVGAGTTWSGRALAFDGLVTTGAAATITVPTCTPPPATLHVIKQVINDDSRTAIMSDFNLYVKQAGMDVAGSPAAGSAAPGTTYSLPPGTYTISEDVNSDYVQTFSGDCDSNGTVILASEDDSTCTVTNDDIAAVIIPPVRGNTPDPTIPIPDPTLPAPDPTSPTQPFVPGFPDTGLDASSIKYIGLGIMISAVAILYMIRRRIFNRGK